MLIMSQKKDFIYNTDRLNRVYIYNPCGRSGVEVWADFGGCDDFILGSYATETRAKEVLGLIYYRWYSGSNTYEMPEE